MRQIFEAYLPSQPTYLMQPAAISAAQIRIYVYDDLQEQTWSSFAVSPGSTNLTRVV
jgi:hypothetical protein